jgi:hypothetical protein
VRLRCIVALTLALLGGAAALAQEEEQTPGEPLTQPAQGPQFGQPGFGIEGYETAPNYVDLDVGAAYTDNAQLVSKHESSTLIGLAGLLVNYAYIGSNLNLILQGNVDWLHYFDNAFRNPLYGNFNGTAMWGHPTDLLQWVVRETFSDGQSNPLAAATPTAYEEINYFTTGPYVNFNFGAFERLTLFGLYSDMAFESSPFNSQTIDGGSTFTHKLTALSSVSLQADDAYTSYQDPRTPAEDEADAAQEEIPASSSYNLRSVRLFYNTDVARTRAEIAVGYSWEDYGTHQYSGSPLVMLDIGRVLSAYSTIYVRGTYGYSSFGDSLRNSLSGPLGGPSVVGATSAEFATAAPFKDHEISVGWDFNRARTSFELVGSVLRDDYVDEPLFNSTGKIVTATLSRELLPTMWLRLTGLGSYYRYGDLDGRTTLASENVSLVRDFRRLGVSLYYQRNHQAYSGAANPAGLATGAYVENRVGIQVYYDVVGQRRGPPGAGIGGIGGLGGLH